MQRSSWFSLSVVGLGGLAAGTVLGLTLDRAPRPAPLLAPGTESVSRASSAATEAPGLAARPPSPRPGRVLTIDLADDVKLAWALFDALLSAERFPEAVRAALVVCALDASRVPAVETKVSSIRAPADRLGVFEALRAAGIALPASPAAYAALRALSGREAEVMREDPSALSRADATTFRVLLAAALREGLDAGALRSQAERDAWPAWKLQAVAGALAAANHAEAPTWAALAVGVEAREVEAREVARQAGDADAVAQARQQVADRPESAEAWTELGNALLERGADLAGAIDAYQRALDLDPYALEPAQGLSLHAPDRLLPRILDRWKELPDDERLAVLVATSIRTGHGREAAQAFFRCRDLDTAWLLAGLAALAPAHCLAAIETRLALPGHDHDEVLRLAKADALVALGRLDEASETLGALLAAGQEGWDLWPRLLEVDPKRVIAHFEARTPPPPGDEDTRAVWGDALRRTGRAAEGRRVVAPFAAAHASDWPAFAHVAPEVAALDPTTWLPRVEARTRDPEENESPEPWVALARAYALLGRRGEALRIWDEAIARDPEDLGLWIQRLRGR